MWQGVGKMAQIVNFIQMFVGADYSSYRSRLFMFLKMKKVEMVAKRIMSATDDSEKWAESNIDAMNYIFATVSNKQLEYLKNLDSAFEMITKLDNMYLAKSTALQIVKRSELENIKLKNYNSEVQFF